MSTRHQVIREEMSQTSENNLLSSSAQDHSLQNLNKKMLMMIEAQMPQELVEKFIATYESSRAPSTGILLYNIWKNFKDLIISNPIEDQSIIEAINQTSLENSVVSPQDDYEIQFDGSLNVIDEQDLLDQYPSIPSSSINNSNLEDNMIISSSLVELSTRLEPIINRKNHNNSSDSMALITDFDMSIDNVTYQKPILLIIIPKTLICQLIQGLMTKQTIIIC
ncbi:uncharacterized protein LOC106693280 [Microplitis demolitor]|uniref:uncharacterized protein LOC106693280 n=1 Tax=Microplitis demolitor TaxID=69319 RepID=UPI00235B5BB0|nr:uncharacterized protein LOC106693280 [Microplitis demolitor]